MPAPRKIDPADYVTPAHAAELAGMSRAHVYAGIKAGRIPSIRIDGVPFVHRADAPLIVPGGHGGRGRKKAPQ